MKEFIRNPPLFRIHNVLFFFFTLLYLVIIPSKIKGLQHTVYEFKQTYVVSTWRAFLSEPGFAFYYKHTLYLRLVQRGGAELVYPVTMCTRSDPDPVPESQPFSPEVEDSEREASDEGRERESDRDSAVGSTQGSDTSDSLIRPGDKDDALGDLFLPVEK